MNSDPRIALQVPVSKNENQYFTVRITPKVTSNPSVYPAKKKIFVISNNSGEYRSLVKLMMKAGILSKYLTWSFGDGHLVILGNYFKEPYQAEALWLIYSLEEQAQRNGGRVHFIIGKDEISCFTFPWRLEHPKYASGASGYKKPFTALFNGNMELHRWLKSKNIVEKIGNLLFVSAGISPVFNKLPYSLEEINKLARLHYDYVQQVFHDPLPALIFNRQDSPFLYKGYYNGSANEEDVNATLLKFGVTNIINAYSGHEQINVGMNGKVINVYAENASGRPEALLISRKHIYRVAASGKREKIR